MAWRDKQLMFIVGVFSSQDLLYYHFFETNQVSVTIFEIEQSNEWLQMIKWGGSLCSSRWWLLQSHQNSWYSWISNIHRTMLDGIAWILDNYPIKIFLTSLALLVWNEIRSAETQMNMIQYAFECYHVMDSCRNKSVLHLLTTKGLWQCYSRHPDNCIVLKKIVVRSRYIHKLWDTLAKG